MKFETLFFNFYVLPLAELNRWGTCRLNGTVPEMNEQLGPAVLEGVVSTCRLLVDVVAFYLVISGLYIPNL